jgi:hypothetical protein
VSRVGVGVILSLVVWLVLLVPSASPTQAQSPEPSGATVIVAGDPRSDGEGPGLVGSPLLIALGVVVLGVLTAAGTVLVIRLTRR